MNWIRTPIKALQRAWRTRWGKRLIKLALLAILGVTLLACYNVYKQSQEPTPECFSKDNSSFVAVNSPVCRTNDTRLFQFLRTHPDNARETLQSISQFPVTAETPMPTPVRVIFNNPLKTRVDVHFGEMVEKGLFQSLAQKAGFNMPIETLQPEAPRISWLSVALNVGPIILLAAVFIGLFVAQQKGWMKPSMGKNKAKLLHAGNQQKVTFKDVDGLDDAKRDCEDIIGYLEEPEKYDPADIPKGVILVGPPGTGKTLFARAIAGEANVPFYTISGSDFVEMFVGVGASRVRDMFEQAKKNAPCIIFVDEIDAVGRHRGTGTGGGNDEREQTLNQLLVEMDGFDSKDGTRPAIILIAATNRPDVLDPALMRKGRFDRQIEVPVQDLAGREKMLDRLFEKARRDARANPKKASVDAAIDVKKWARKTLGASPADLENLVKEAKLRALRENRRVATDEDFDEAYAKIQYGSVRAFIMTDDEKQLTAYHEGGHALVGLERLEKHGELVSRGTIVPRRRALGMINFLAQRDQVSTSFGKVKALLATTLGGRAAECIIAGGNPDEVTSGAKSDIEMATKLAEAAITEYGFGPYVDPRLAFLRYGSPQTDEPFLGYELATRRGVSMSAEEVALVRAAVSKLVNDAFADAMSIIMANTEEWFAISAGLFEHETLEREEILNRVNAIRKAKELPVIELEPVHQNGGKLTLAVVQARAATTLALAKPGSNEEAGQAQE